MGFVKQYYYDGWGTIRNHNADTAVVIHDAFENIDSYWNGFMNSQSGLNNVILDTHIYQVFTDQDVAMSPSEHVSTACGQAQALSSTDKWTIVGEWTGAQTDCAQWLNGKGNGARYDGTYENTNVVGSCDGKYQGTVEDLSADDKQNLRSLIEAQLDAYAAHTVSRRSQTRVSLLTGVGLDLLDVESGKCSRMEHAGPNSWRHLSSAAFRSPVSWSMQLRSRYRHISLGDAWHPLRQRREDLDYRRARNDLLLAQWGFVPRISFGCTRYDTLPTLRKLWSVHHRKRKRA